MHAVYRLMPFVSVNQARLNLMGTDSIETNVLGAMR